MPTAAWTAPPTDRASLIGATADVMEHWHVRSAFVSFWVRTACDHARDLGELRLVLDYDADVGLLSFDAYSGEHRVYGADDWIG